MHSGGRIEKASGGEQVIGGNECSGGGEASGGLRGGHDLRYFHLSVCAQRSRSRCVWTGCCSRCRLQSGWKLWEWPCRRSPGGAAWSHNTARDKNIQERGGNRLHTCSLESHLWISSYSSVMNFTFRVLTYWLSCYVTNQLRTGTLIYCIAQPQCLQFRHHCHK